MNPFLLVAVPLVLLILGMILNSLGSSPAHPESSSEQDPAKRLVAEKEAYRRHSDLQVERFLKRQQRVGQYAWLVLVAFVVSFGWLYFDTVIKTTASKQIAAIQTVPVSEGKEVVLSLTLNDGRITKYLIKAENGEISDGDAKDSPSIEPITSWELTHLETALSTGKNRLPVGVALSIAN